MMLPVALLAGGLATRLRPLTQTCPKSLVEVNGEPFIAHQLRLLKNKGVKKVVICTGFLGEMIEEYVQTGAQFGLDVTYSFDGEILLGTGGALKKALPLLGDYFLVLYGDSYLDCDYEKVVDFFIHSDKQGLMTVFKNDKQWDTSNVIFKHHEVIVYDKKQLLPEMDHIDYGLGAFSANAFQAYPLNTFFDLAEVYQDLLKQQQLAGFEVMERFYEMGSKAGLDALEQKLMKRT